MNFTDIETFLMIVKTKSITKSAENLFLTQPTISHRLKTLENELNFQLVIRKKGFKSIELTSKGEEFVSIAERWISLWNEMKVLEQDPGKLFLTIGCIDTLNSTIMTPFYQKLLHADPPVNLNIRTHQSFEIYDLLEKHDIDIGIVFHNLYFKNIISEPLVEEPFYIVQPKENCIKKRSVHIEELDVRKELFFNWHDNYRIWHDQWIKRTERSFVQVDTFQMLLGFMQTGEYWMIAPTSVIRELAKCDLFHFSEIANKPGPPKRITYRIRHKIPSISNSRAVELFNELLTDYLEQVNNHNQIFIRELLK